MAYENGAYRNNQRNRSNYHPRFGEGNLPDESWQVGDSRVEASVWIKESGDQRLDLRTRNEDGVLCKTFSPSDTQDMFRGLAEHCARLTELDGLSPEEIDVFSFLADATVDLLENTPSLEQPKKKPRRKKTNRRS